MKIDGIEGESQSPQFPGYIDAFGTSFGIEREAATGGGSGGRPDLSDITVIKQWDSSTPKLIQACCNGGRAGGAEIVFTTAVPGAEFIYLVISLVDVRVTSYGSSGDGGAVPTESVTFNYAKIKWDYTKQDGTKVTASWDIKKNSIA